jgi:hypothetical protein
MNSNETCHRCRSKEATYTCLMCDSFKYLCNQCDLYVHGLPSKKKHKRAICNYDNQKMEITNHNNTNTNNNIFQTQTQNLNVINQTKPLQQNEKMNFINYNQIEKIDKIDKNDKNEKNEVFNSTIKSFPTKMVTCQIDNQRIGSVDWDSKFNFSSTITGTNDFMKTTQKENFGVENKNINIVENSYNYLSPVEQKENFNTLPNKLSVTEDSLVRENLGYNPNPNPNNPFFSVKPANFNTFSREYMTELKNIFEKEKNELIYKNNTLQTNLDRLKINFTEQVK